MKKVDDRKRTRDKCKSISKLELKDDGLHLANYAAVDFNKKIAEFHNKNQLHQQTTEKMKSSENSGKNIVKNSNSIPLQKVKREK